MPRIYEYRWKDEKNQYFRSVDYNNNLMEAPIQIGQNISIELTGDVVCTGYEKNFEWKPCISGGVPGVKKCEECKRQEGMPIAQYCDGFNTDMFSGEEVESLSTDHYVYFALFDENLIKVGVSSSSRGFMRQVEQGSHFSLIIADGLWGVPARQMETIIRRTGMIDKIQSSQKKNLIFPKLTEEQGKSVLMKLFEEKIPAVLAEKPDFEQFIKKEPEFKSFSDVYHLSEGEAIQKPLEDTPLVVGESVSGKIISAKGPFIVIETDAEKYLLEAKKLKGYEVNFSEKSAGLNKLEGFQGALF